jgi:uncharacterized protein YecE (DUF72 family)
MSGKILVGTCNWADHKDFYPRGTPAGERLHYYSDFFPIVEADTTFYGIPKPEVTARWVELTPATFRFNVKAYRSLTMHERGADGKPRRAEPGEERDFLRMLGPLRDAGKLRAVHYQFPPWFTSRPRNMDYLAEIRERHPGDQVIVEMRHRSWAEAERFAMLTELLEEADMTYCVVDEPQLGSGSMRSHIAVPSKNLGVLRMHGRNYKKWYVKGKTSAERFDYLYTEEELLEWVPHVRGMADRANEVHVLFNNNRGNYAVVNGLQMANLLDLGYPSPGSVTASRPEPEPGAPATGAPANLDSRGGNPDSRGGEQVELPLKAR